MPKFVTQNGVPVNPDDPKRAIWYSTMCGYWTDDWDTLKKFGFGIPCCPHCQTPGMITDFAGWDKGVKEYDATHPGYEKFINDHKNKCVGRDQWRESSKRFFGTNPEYKEVPPSAGQAIAEQFDKDIVVIVSIDWAHDKTHFTSFGKSGADKLNAAKLAEAVSKAILEETEPTQYFHDFRKHGGAGLIAAERARQISGEGYTAEHDDGHVFGELSEAGAAYASVASAMIRGASANEFTADMMLDMGDWPSNWEEESWKPSDDPIRNLVKAGALIAAEIDRLLRAKNHDSGRAERAAGTADRVAQRSELEQGEPRLGEHRGDEAAG